jgi:hypothetical protein
LWNACSFILLPSKKHKNTQKRLFGFWFSARERVLCDLNIEKKDKSPWRQR